MEELSIEQKAKHYDEAIEKAKDLISRCKSNRDRRTMIYRVEDIEHIFPELRDSEDERIRKQLLKHLREVASGKSLELSTTDYERWATWVEKQGEQKPVIEMITPEESLGISSEEYNKIVDECIYGEQKPTDKVEPKFKVGDWVVFNNKHQSIYQVEKIEDGYYILRHTHGGTFRVCVLHDKSLRLWNISDVKDGDVVADKSDGAIGIFQSIGHHPDGGSYNDPSYCFLHCHYDDGFFYADFENGNTIDSDYLVPATKEQRDTLIQAMTDAGYTFDFEKKELKKIEQAPAWSEEDEINIKELLYLVEANHLSSEEPHDRLIKFLKSLKDRYTWKPSDEQMNVLWSATEKYLESDNENIRKLIGEVLDSLYEQLNKLRKE